MTQSFTGSSHNAVYRSFNSSWIALGMAQGLAYLHYACNPATCIAILSRAMFFWMRIWSLVSPTLESRSSLIVVLDQLTRQQSWVPLATCLVRSPSRQSRARNWMSTAPGSCCSS